MSGHVLDLSRHAFHRELGDITLYGTWVGESLDESEPCLVLVPTRRQTFEKVVPCCIALSSAYKYNDPSYLLQAAMGINQQLGFTDDMAHVHKIASIIHDHLQDLIEMPPKPVRKEYVAAEATMTDGWGRTRTASILDYE